MAGLRVKVTFSLCIMVPSMSYGTSDGESLKLMSFLSSMLHFSLTKKYKDTVHSPQFATFHLHLKLFLFLLVKINMSVLV